MIAEVIKQYAPEYRQLYCQHMCPGRNDCLNYYKYFKEDIK